MQDVTIPALGMAMTEAVLTRWHKQSGDRVSAGDVLAEIETDKTNVDLESPADGVLGRHLVEEGAVVAVGSAVIRLLHPGEAEEGGAPAAIHAAQATAGPHPDPRDATADVSSPVEPAVPPVPVAPPIPSASSDPGPSTASPTPSATSGSGAADDGDIRRYNPPARAPHALSPRKRRLARLEAEAEAFFAVSAEGGPTQAREAAAALRAPVPATGIGATGETATGETAAAGTASRAPANRAPGRYRAAVAERVTRSWHEIPHFAVQREVEAGEADSVLAAVRVRDPGAGLTDLLLRAYALAIRAVVPGASGDVGLAVATPDGVLMPVVAAVPDLDVSSLVTRRTSAVRRGREGKLSPHDLTSTPVGSLSNLGSRGVDSFTGIIPLQQQLLLTVGRVKARPAVADGRLVVRTTVIATLNVDHRRFDGDQAAGILAAFEGELGALRGWAEGERP